MGTATQRKGVMLALGGFALPVNVESALEGTKEVSLNTLCTQGHGPAQTRQTLKCPVCDNADKNQFAKGKDMGSGRFVVVPDNVLNDLGVGEGEKNQLQINTHPADQIGRAMPGEKCYFLVPSSPAAGETYALVAALINSRPDLVFVTRWAVRSALAMYQLIVFDGVLALKQLAWPGAVRALPEVPTVYNEAMLPLAAQLADAMCVPFVPGEYVDDRSAGLLKFISEAEAVAGADVKDDDGPAVPVVAQDLEAMLKASVQAALVSKGVPEQPPAEVTELVVKKKAPAPRKRAAKKVAAPAAKSA